MTEISAFSIDPDTAMLIVVAAIATYFTRIGGYVLMSSMKRIPPRVESALNAVPAAVLTTLVAPPFIYGGWDIKIAMVVALVVGLRFPGLTILAVGWAAVMAARYGLGLGA
ncbi:AzlD family protein [Aliirhizobium smilacinae]|uniref:AzlD family protein n=1 Tax=Aliirhizobium smilacinae TaxID=1395944 RepID=A0A5C4XGA9_9HYPH|nr:AzlD family protein [Rhizobium smilacinae]TNM62239.1 AzlD family protein [Rhizobium smilacinae]